MTNLEYEVLSSLEAGRSVFRPRALSPEAQQAFIELMGLLLRLRKEGHVWFPDGRISKTEAGRSTPRRMPRADLQGLWRVD